MASDQSIQPSTAGGTYASTALQSIEDALVVEDFSSWPGENRLGEYSNAGAMVWIVEDSPAGALQLQYEGGGWFLTNVRRDLSNYATLELDVRGAEGGEEEGVQLEVGNVEGPLAELADGSVGTEWSTLSVDLEAAGVERSSVQDVWLNFWRAGEGTLEIDEIRFVPDQTADLDCVQVDGQSVCDVNDDGLYRDVTGDGSVGQTDVVEFFQVQHREAWKQPDLFDFSGNGDVGHGDVVQLFEDVATDVV